MHRQPITIRNPRGIHLRPTTLVLEMRNRFAGTSVWLSGKSGSRVAIDSPLDLMGMGLTVGTSLILETEGPDEVLCAIKTLILFSNIFSPFIYI